LIEPRPPQRDEFHALSADMVGAWRTATIAAAVALDVPAALPADLDTLARRRDLPAAQARRLLRALGELDLVHEQAGEWHLTGRGRYLRADHPETLADAALAYQGHLLARWQALPSVLRAPHWRPPDFFAAVAADPSHVEPHHRMQRSYARHDYAAVAAALEVPSGARIIDAGGGTGTLARLLLDRTPDATAVVLERPEVAALVPQHDRISAVPADLFAPWPVHGELIVLARVLHDWDDLDASTILRHARQALVPGGRLALVELLLEEHDFGGSLCDLHLAVACGGRERSLAELSTLLASAGFTAPHHIPIAGIPQLLTAVPA
jgi:SAM-dependent methyltransferase